jgi:hypothetical protein
MSNLTNSFKKFFAFLLIYAFTVISVDTLNPGLFDKLDRRLIKVFDQDSTFDSRTFPISYTYSMNYVFPVIPTPTFAHVYSSESNGEHLPITLIESDTSRISRLNGYILVNVSTPNETMYDVTDYEYSTDDGVTWRSNGTGPFSGNPADAPVVIQKLSVDGTTSLSSNSTYPIKIRAIGYLNWGYAHFDYQTRVEGIPSETYYGRTAGVPNITEIIGSITPGNKRLSFEVYTDEPGGNGGFNITDYEYSTDDGVSWRSAGVSPVPDGGDVQVVITKLSSDGVTNLSDNTTYQVKVRAVNNFGGTKAGKGTPSIRYLGNTFGVPAKPEIFSVVQGNLQFILNSSGDEIDTGGFSISNWQYSTDNGSTWKSTGQTGLTLNNLTISQVSGSSENLVLGVTYQLKIRAINSAGNGPESDSFAITATSGGGSSGGGSSGGSGSPGGVTPNPPPPIVINQVQVNINLFLVLTADQISSITPNQIRTISTNLIRRLNPDSATGLTPEQIKAFSPNQIRFMSVNVISILSPQQIAGLEPNDFRVLTNRQIANISAEAAAGISAADLKILNRNQLKSFRPNVIANIQPTVLKSLSVSNLRNLTPAQKRSVSEFQRKALSSGQLRAIRI